MASQTTRLTSFALILVLSGTPTALAVCAAQCMAGVPQRADHGAQPSSPVPPATVAAARHPDAPPADGHRHHASATERPDATHRTAAADVGSVHASGAADRGAITLASGTALTCCARGEAPAVGTAAARADAGALLATAVMAPGGHTPPCAQAADGHRATAGTPPPRVRTALVLRI